MQRERAEYIQGIIDCGGDLSGRADALEFIAHSDMLEHGRTARFSYVPYLFNADDMAFITDVCHTIHSILCKVIDRYLHDASYRSLFHFPPEVERLILLPCGYDQLLPIGRFDLFLDERDRSFKFCEFNTDGCGAMSRNLMIGETLEPTASFKHFAARHDVEPFELFDSWVRAFMRIYRSDAGAVEHPTIAVTDFRESGVFSDFDRFIAAFKRAGYSARFVDVRAFDFDGEHLRDASDGTIIDAIYRRAVTSELVEHPGECDAFIDAVAAGKVCLIGHFRTTVVHSKMVNCALFDEETRNELFTAEERAFIDAHVPRTYRLRSDIAALDLDDVKAHKDAWIIKPADDYGAQGVKAGVDQDQETWERLIDDYLDADYIIQEFYQPPSVPLIDSKYNGSGDPCAIENWESMPGFFQYDGEPVGFYCRLGHGGIIALDHGGLCATSFKVDC